MGDRLVTVNIAASAGGHFGPDTVRFLDASGLARRRAASIRQHHKNRKRAAAKRRLDTLEALTRELVASGLSRDDAAAQARAEIAAAERAAVERSIVDNPDKAPRNPALLPYMVDDAIARRHEIIRSHVAKAERERDRLVGAGYVWDAETSPHGETLKQEPFVYRGLRSNDHPLIARFVSTLPRVGRPRRGEEYFGLVAGYDKALLEPAASKLLALDAPYVEGNKRVRGWFRVDCDGCFPSWEALAYCIKGMGVPLPHLAVAEVLPCGMVLRPHLVWFLPASGPVRFDDAAPAKPRALWRGILKGLHAALIDIGADPGGCHNPMRIKNPCSPHWGVAVLNEADPLSMTEMADALAGYMNLSEEEIASRHAAAWAERGGVERKESNSLFGHLVRASWLNMRDWKRTRDRRSTLEGDDLARAFYDELRPVARHMLGDDPAKVRQAHAILRKATTFAASTYDPDKADTRKRRGILRDDVRGRNLAERQAAGAAFVSGERKDDTLDAIRAAVRSMREAGETVTQSEVARRIGKTRRTVIRRWEEALSEAPASAAPATTTEARAPAARPARKERTMQTQTPKPKSTYARPAFLRDTVVKDAADTDEQRREIERRMNAPLDGKGTRPRR